MFECKSCGGALRFDVALQKLKCPYCDNTYDPYEVNGGNSPKEVNEYDTTVFICSQCGGELGGDDFSAAEFCSFCGNSAVFESRLSRMKSPDYIIPFSVTREDSAKILRRHLKKAFFVPKAFKDCDIEKVRGIYMPCWSYNITQKGEVKLKLAEDKGDYVQNYEATADIDVEYKGIPHDASQSFADRISECLEPYNYKERKTFTPSFLAGFFSDVQDVDPYRYEIDACNFAAQNTYKHFLDKISAYSEHVKEIKERDLPEVFHTRLEEPDSTLIPVWFMSYRKNKRVAYATVNGETGKIFTDLPLSIGRLWVIALILAVPIFFLLNMFVSMRATTMFYISVGFLALADYLYSRELEKLRLREEAAQWEHAERKKDKPKKKGSEFTKKEIGCIGCGTIPILLIVLSVLSAFIEAIAVVVILALIVLTIGLPIWGMYNYNKRTVYTHVYGFIPMLLMGLMSFCVYFSNPISDVAFYTAIIGNLAAIVIALSDAWRLLNRLTTRPLPQLNKRGGDEYENR